MVAPYPDVLQDAFRQARDADASLNERLEHFAEAVRSFSASFADAVDRLIARLRQHGTGLSAPVPGDAMPPFVLTDDDGHLVTLDEVLSSRTCSPRLSPRSLVPLLPYQYECACGCAY